MKVHLFFGEDILLGQNQSPLQVPEIWIRHFLVRLHSMDVLLFFSPEIPKALSKRGRNSREVTWMKDISHVNQSNCLNPIPFFLCVCVGYHLQGLLRNLGCCQNYKRIRLGHEQACTPPINSTRVEKTNKFDRLYIQRCPMHCSLPLQLKICTSVNHWVLLELIEWCS